MIVAFCLSLSVLVFKDERFHECSGTTEAVFSVVVKVGLSCQSYCSVISLIMIIIAFILCVFLKAYTNMTSMGCYFLS